jgi:hypothetical protein
MVAGANHLNKRVHLPLIIVQSFGRQTFWRMKCSAITLLSGFPKRDDRAASDHQGTADDDRQRG